MKKSLLAQNVLLQDTSRYGTIRNENRQNTYLYVSGVKIMFQRT